MSAATSAVAAAVARERRRVVESLRAAGAVVPDRAVAPATLGDVRFHLLARLQRSGAIRTTADGLVYLDEAAWAAQSRLRRATVAVVLVAVAIAVAAGVYAAR